jgi:hypothetical protein
MIEAPLFHRAIAISWEFNAQQFDAAASKTLA